MMKVTVSMFGLAVVVAVVSGCRTKLNADSCLNSPCSDGLLCDQATQRCIVPDAGASPGGVGGVGSGGMAGGGGAVDAGAAVNADSGAGEGGAPNDGGTDGDGAVPFTGTLFITNPTATLYTNKPVSIQIGFSDGAPVPVQVDLLKNGAALATLFPPAPFAFTWDTTVEIEGTYAITARAMLAGQIKVSDPVTVHVDRTPPTVVTQIPVPDDLGVDIHAPIQLGLSETLLPSSVTASSLVVSSAGVSLTGPSVLGADGQTITTTVLDGFTLTLPAALMATIAPTITDLAGNAFVPSADPWSWSAPDWMMTPKIPTAAGPILRVDQQGRPIVAYSQSTQIGPSVFLQTLKLSAYQNGSWSSPFGSPASYPDAARLGYGLDLDAAGNPTLAWSEPGTDANYIHVASWTGTSWNTTYPPLDGTPGATSATHPSVRVDKSGSPVVTWQENTTAGAPDVFVARWTGTTWDHSYGSLGLSYASVGSGDLVLDGQSSPVVAWTVSAGSGVATWNGAWMLSPPLPGVSNPTVALDATGSPLAAARGSDLRVANLMAGQWVNEEAVVPSTSAIQSPSLALAADGGPVIAWLDTNAPASVGLAHWTATAWDVRFGLFNAGLGVAPLGQVPALTVDGRGRIWVAWQEGGNVNVWRSNY
jgi:hypothetical protein